MKAGKPEQQDGERQSRVRAHKESSDRDEFDVTTSDGTFKIKQKQESEND